MSISLNRVRCLRNGDVYLDWVSPNIGHTLLAGYNGTDNFVTQFEITIENDTFSDISMTISSDTDIDTFSSTQLAWGISDISNIQINNNYNNQQGEKIGNFYFPYSYTNYTFTGKPLTSKNPGIYYISIWNGSEYGAFAKINSKPNYPIVLSYTPANTSTSTTCIPPTFVSYGPTYVGPGKEINVTWSGAQSGKNNPINNIHIYVQYEDFKELEYITNLKNTSGNYSLVVGEDVPRGTRILIWVGIVDSNGTKIWNFDNITYNNYCYINTLPTKVEITSNIILKLTENSKKIEISTPYDPDTSQEVEIWYSKDNWATRTKVQENQVELEVGQYKFDSFDGIEWSGEEVSCNVTKNTIPVFESIIVTPTLSKIVKSTTFDGVSTYKISAEIKVDRIGTVEYYYRLANLNSNTYNNPVKYGTINLSKKTHNFNLNIGEKVLAGKKYQIGFKLIDSLGDSSDIIWSSEYKIANFPDAPNIINSNSDNNVDGARSSEFYRYIRAIFSYDETYINNNKIINISCKRTKKDGSDSTSIPITLFSSSKEEGFIKIDLDNAENKTEANQDYLFVITLNNGYTLKKYQFTKKKTPIFTIEGVAGGAFGTSPIDVYDNNILSSTTISFGKIADVTTYTKWKKYYNISNNNINFTIKNGSKNLISITTEDPVIEGDQIKIAFTFYSSLYKNIIEQFKNDKLYGKYNYYLYYSVINAFGAKSSGKIAFQNDTYFFKASLDKLPELSEPSNGWIQYEGLNNLSYTLDKNNHLICEKLKFHFKPVIKYYGGKQYQYRIYIGESISTDVLPTKWTILKKDTENDYNEIESKITESKTVNKDIIYVMPEIITDNYCWFKFELIHPNGFSVFLKTNGINNFGPFLLKKHTTPDFVLNSISYFKEEAEDNNIVVNMNIKFNSNLNIKTNYIDNSKSFAIISYSPDRELIENLSSTNLIPENSWQNIDKNNNPSKLSLIGIPEIYQDSKTGYAKVEIKTSSSTIFDNNYSITNEKVAESNITLFYNSVPTIACRQNYLGINCNNFANDELIAIKPGSGRNIIRLYFASNLPGQVLNINLENGKISGAILDGGSWDVDG